MSEAENAHTCSTARTVIQTDMQRWGQGLREGENKEAERTDLEVGLRWV